MAPKTRISKRTGLPVRQYRRRSEAALRGEAVLKAAKLKVKARKTKKVKSTKPPSLGPQGEEALWKPLPKLDLSLVSAQQQAEIQRLQVSQISSDLLLNLARGAGAYPTGEDIRDLVRNVRVMLSEVDHPTTRPVDKPQPASEVAALPFQEDDLLEGV